MKSNYPGGFCTNCGSPLKPDARFCPRCEMVLERRKRKGLIIALIITACIVLVSASVFGILKLTRNFSAFTSIKSTLGGSGDGQVKVGKAEEKQPDESKVINTKAWGDVPANQIVIIYSVQ